MHFAIGPRRLVGRNELATRIAMLYYNAESPGNFAVKRDFWVQVAMSQSTTQHRCESPKSVRCAVVTISDTRTIETDRGGALIVEMLAAGGHGVSGRHIVRDDPAEIEPLLRKAGRSGSHRRRADDRRHRHRRPRQDIRDSQLAAHQVDARLRRVVSDAELRRHWSRRRC